MKLIIDGEYWGIGIPIFKFLIFPFRIESKQYSWEIWYISSYQKCEYCIFWTTTYSTIYSIGTAQHSTVYCTVYSISVSLPYKTQCEILLDFNKSVLYFHIQYSPQILLYKVQPIAVSKSERRTAHQQSALITFRSYIGIYIISYLTNFQKKIRFISSVASVN